MIQLLQIQQIFQTLQIYKSCRCYTITTNRINTTYIPKTENMNIRKITKSISITTFCKQMQIQQMLNILQALHYTCHTYYESCKCYKDLKYYNHRKYYEYYT